MAALPLSALIEATSPAPMLAAYSPNVAAISPPDGVAAFSPNTAAFSPIEYSAGAAFTSPSEMTPGTGRMGYATPSAHQSILDQVMRCKPSEQAKHFREMQQKWQAAAQFFQEKEKKLTAAAARSEAAAASGMKGLQAGAAAAKDARGKAAPAPAVCTTPYTPGETLAKAFESSVTVEMDVSSECSTSDSTAATPASPEPAYVCETSKVNSDPKFNLADLPSAGSSGHHIGDCKPCAFFLKKGCENGTTCEFCHLCDSGEKKRRFKAKKAHFTALKEMPEMPVEELTFLL